jgi:hypothetical protein
VSIGGVIESQNCRPSKGDCARFLFDPMHHRFHLVSTLATVERAIRDNSSDITFCGSTDQSH